jgi:hypothetical protein
MIVTNGSVDAPSSANQIIFLGNVSTYSVSALPDEDRFSGLKTETGTFMLAPGFSTSFGGNFNTTVDGVIAASGVEFFGNAGGTINGTVLNYSDTAITMTGSTNIMLNPSGSLTSPSGFSSVKALEFVPESYSEVVSSYQ